MMNEINQLLMGLGIATSLAVLVVFGVINSTFVQDYKETKKIFKNFCTNGYHYRCHVGNQIWFSRNDELGERYQYNEIVFFGDGSIKLRENYYIHKGFLTFTLVHRYYYRKFHRVKEQYINRHLFNEEYGRWTSRANNDSNVKINVESFKFFRG